MKNHMSAAYVRVAEYCHKLHLHYIPYRSEKEMRYKILSEDYDYELFLGTYRECMAFFYGMLYMQDKYEGRVPLYMEVEDGRRS